MSLFGERRGGKSPRIEIIPMVDVMFLLLVFYILSSLALSTQHGIPVELPRASTGQGSQIQEVVVTIDRRGDFYLNREKIDPASLAEEVEVLALGYPGGLEGLSQGNLVINADMEVPHRLVVRAMDELRSIGLNHFAIATEYESREP